MNKPSVILLSMLLAAVGCNTSDTGEPADEPSNQTVPDAPVTDPVPPMVIDDDWSVTPAAAGPLRIGMSLAEMAPYLAADVDTATLDVHCDWVRPDAAPDSMLFMVVSGQLVRVDVTGGNTATSQGARVGDTENRIRSLYPAATRGPHKYTDGAYLTVTSGGADSTSKIIFETDGERVTRYRAGIAPPVDYVEGCS